MVTASGYCDPNFGFFMGPCNAFSSNDGKLAFLQFFDGRIKFMKLVDADVRNNRTISSSKPVQQVDFGQRPGQKRKGSSNGAGSAPCQQKSPLHTRGSEKHRRKKQSADALANN